MMRLGQKVNLHGIIKEEPDDMGFKKSLVVDIGDTVLETQDNSLFNFIKFNRYFDSKYRSNKIRLTVNCPRCQFGHPIDFVGTINIPSSSEDFDSNLFLLSRGIQFEMLDAKISKIYPLDKGLYFENCLYDFKNIFVDKIKLSLSDKEESALGAGILITGKGDLSKKTLDDFKRSGLIHMVVLSGFNVSIVAQVIISILSFLPKIITAIFGSVGIVLFCIMVGGGSTVIRSLIMSLIGIYAKVFDLDYSALMSVLLAGALMIIDNPIVIIGDPSFQLSFACTLGLILLGNASKCFFSFVPERFGLRELVSSSVAVQIFSLPLLLKFSGNLSVYGIIANIIVVPFIPFMMLSVFFMGVLCFINVDFSMVFTLVSHLMLSYVLSVVKYISGLNSAVFEIGKTSNIFILCWYLTVIPVSSIIYKKFIDENDISKNKKHSPYSANET